MYKDLVAPTPNRCALSMSTLSWARRLLLVSFYCVCVCVLSFSNLLSQVQTGSTHVLFRNPRKFQPKSLLRVYFEDSFSVYPQDNSLIETFWCPTHFSQWRTLLCKRLTLPYYENTHQSLRHSVFQEYLRQAVTSSCQFTTGRLATLRQTFSTAKISVENPVFLLKNLGFLRRTNFFSCWREFGHCFSVLLVLLIPNMYSDPI